MSKKSTTDAAVEQQPKDADAGTDLRAAKKEEVAESFREDSKEDPLVASRDAKAKELRPVAASEHERAVSAVKLDPKKSEDKTKASGEGVKPKVTKEAPLEPKAGKTDDATAAEPIQEVDASQLILLFDKQKEIERLRAENPLLPKDDQERANYLRANFSNLAPSIAGLGLEGKLSDKELEKVPEKWSKMSYTQVLEELEKLEKPEPGLTHSFLIKKLKESLEKEQLAGVFGPATKKAYESTINWFEKKELPSILAVAGMLGVKPDANLPQILDKEGKPLTGTDADTISVLLAYGLADAKIGLDSKKVPTEADLDKFDSAFRWASQMKEKLVKVQLDQAESEINRDLEALGLGPEYKRQEGEEQSSWVQAATKNLKIITEVRNHMETMLNLYRASEGKFALDLPAGKGFRLEYKGKEYTITQKDIVGGKVSADLEKALRFGSLKESRFDFMSDHKATPDNVAKQEALTSYLERLNPRVKQGVQEIIKVKENQDALVLYADQPIESGLARFAKLGLERALLGDEATEAISGLSKREALYKEYLESAKIQLSPDFRKAVVAGLKWIEANPNEGQAKEKYATALEEAINKSLAQRKDKSDQSLELSSVLKEIKRIQELQESPGKYLGMADSKTKAGPNELIQPGNIRAYNFSAEEVTSGEHSGKIKVKQTVQVWNGSIIHYLDWRKIDIPGTDASIKVMDSVGISSTLREDYLNPTDFVPVRDGASVRLVQAKDLQSFLSSQWRGYYGHKALTGGMDIVFGAMALASIVATGGAAAPESAVAVQAARTGLKTAIGQGVALSQAEASMLIRKHLLNLTLAGTGIFNNTAGYQMKAGDVPIGQYLQAGRAVIFTAHIGKGTAEQLWSMGYNGYRRLAQMPWKEIAQAQTLMAGGKLAWDGMRATLPTVPGHGDALTQALLTSMAQSGRPFWPQVHKWSGVAFQPLTFGLGYSLLGPGGEYSHMLAEKEKRDSVSDSVAAYGDGLTRFRKAAEETQAKDRIAPLAYLAQRISAGSSPASANEISSLSRDLTKAQMAQASFEKAKQETDKAEAYLKSEKSQREKTSTELESAKLDLEKRKLENEKTRNEIEEVKARLISNLNSTDRALASFSALSLFYLARDKGGKIPDSFESKAGPISKDLILSKLKSEFFKSELAPHSAAIAESMIDMGLTTASQVAGLYIEKVQTATSRQETVFAMNGIASALAFLKAESLTNSTDRKAAAIKNFGLTFDAVSAQLKRLSGAILSDTRGTGEVAAKVAPEIQAMAAYTLFLSKEPAAGELERGLDWLEKTALTTSPEKLESAIVDNLKSRLEAVPGKDLPPELHRYRLAQAAITFASLTNEGAAKEQSPGNKAALESALKQVLETKVAAVSSPMIDSLPTLLQQVSDKQLANKLIKSMIDLNIVKGTTREQESNTIANLQRLKDFLLEGKNHIYGYGYGYGNDLISHLEDKLLGLVNPRSSEFAETSPKLRVAALETLSVLGSLRSHEIIRLSASAQPFSLAGEEVKASEAKADVRLAAIRALEKVGDPKLAEIVNALLEKESDPIAHSVLQELQLSAGLPIKGSPQELERQTTAAIINLRNRFPHLSNFDADTAQTWLKQKFELLDASTFAQLYKSEATNSGSLFKWVDRKVTEQIAPNAYLAVTEKIKADYLIKQRREQFDSLLNMSKGNSTEADYARMALFYIASENATALTHGGSEVVLKGNYYTGRINEESMQAEAARALAEGSKPGSHSQALSFALSQIAAHSSNDLVRTEFLKAFDLQEDSGRIESAPNLRSLLNEEFSRPAGLQSPQFQEKLLKLIGKLPFRVAEPILEKIIETSPFQEIRQSAAFYFPGPTRTLETGSDQKPFSASDAKDWLKSKFNLLNLPDYIQQYNKTAASRPDWSERNIPHTLRWLYDYTLPPVEKIEKDAGMEIMAQRRNQFQTLLDLAGNGDSPDSEKARYALYYIANNAGFIMGKDGLKYDVSGSYYSGTEKNRDFQIRAAKKLSSLFQLSPAPDSDLSKMLVDGLNNAADPAVRSVYLKGLNDLLSKESSVSGELKASIEKILNQSLLSEVRRPPAQQDAKFQTALIDSLARNKTNQTLPLLKTLAKRAVKEEIRKHAAEAVARLEAQEAPF